MIAGSTAAPSRTPRANGVAATTIANCYVLGCFRGGETCGNDCAHRSVTHAGRAVCETAELYLPAALPRRFKRIRRLARPRRRRAAGEACDQHADLSLPAWRADLGLSLSQDDPGVSGR